VTDRSSAQALRKGRSPLSKAGGPGADDCALLGIGEAAARLGVSDRALRYYEQIGLLVPSGHTPGGLRRYSESDLARVRRIRELQSLLGLNLEEVRAVLANEDRLTALREEYRSAETDPERRRELLVEALEIRAQLRATVAAKISALRRFLADLDASTERSRALLAEGAPPAGEPAGGTPA
jgi:DNA-binding transcriptional MerR regulator